MNKLIFWYLSDSSSLHILWDIFIWRQRVIHSMTQFLEYRFFWSSDTVHLYNWFVAKKYQNNLKNSSKFNVIWKFLQKRTRHWNFTKHFENCFCTMFLNFNLQTCSLRAMDPASSLWLQSCVPQPLWEQSVIDDSVPSQPTSSSQICPLPSRTESPR